MTVDIERIVGIGPQIGVVKIDTVFVVAELDCRLVLEGVKVGIESVVEPVVEVGISVEVDVHIVEVLGYKRRLNN